MSSIRRKLAELKLVNKDRIRFAKINELIQMQSVTVSGDRDSLIKMRDHMIDLGLDDRDYKETDFYPQDGATAQSMIS
jgi:hypothetical protein